jgi:putative effector of murein hydrolase LrgA (UPF0299 family)
MLLRDLYEFISAAAVVSIVVLALALMVGAVKMDDVARRIGVSLILFVALCLLPSLVLSAWSVMSLWQRFVLAFFLALAAMMLHKMRRAPRGRKGK